MDSTIITEEEYAAAKHAQKEAERIITAFNRQSLDNFDVRLKSGKPFTDDELIYAAVARCPCGHGMAYPKGCSPFHYWDCSAILKGIPDNSIKHEARLPFTFYEIKSENQPSAYGASTRTPVDPIPRKA